MSAVGDIQGLPEDFQVEAGRALAVPVDFLVFRRKAPAPRRPAAIVHLYYAELAQEFRLYLSNVPGGIDVYISARDEAGKALVEEAFAGWTGGSLEVRVAPNRGRDIGPKLVAFRDVYDRYDLLLLLHGKKSPHAKNGLGWRVHILETLLGEPKVVQSILALFDRFPGIGMVAADDYDAIRRWLSWGVNLDLCIEIAARMGVTIDAGTPAEFPSGSMFWARPAALRPLLDLDLKAEDFPPENGQEDGTLAHAIERLFYVSCRRAGLKPVKVARDGLQATAPVHAGSEEALSALVREAGP